MAKDIKVNVQVTGYTRLNNSVNGNPRFTLHTVDHGNYTTQSDSGVGYEIGNYFNRASDAAPVAVTLKLTRANRVWDITTEDVE